MPWASEKNIGKNLTKGNIQGNFNFNLTDDHFPGFFATNLASASSNLALVSTVSARRSTSAFLRANIEKNDAVMNKYQEQTFTSVQFEQGSQELFGS